MCFLNYSAIREEEKACLRIGLIEAIKEPNFHIAIQLATLISKAARWEKVKLLFLYIYLCLLMFEIVLLLLLKKGMLNSKCVNLEINISRFKILNIS